jgi:hypothetical protein
MGGLDHILGILKEIRKKIGKSIGAESEHLHFNKHYGMDKIV